MPGRMKTRRPQKAAIAQSASNAANGQLELKKIRLQIDKLDASIVALITKRLSLVSRIVKIKENFKLPISDQKREITIIKNLSAATYDKEVLEVVKTIYAKIFELSRQYQTTQRKK